MRKIVSWHNMPIATSHEMPPRIRAAMEYITFCRAKESGICHFPGDTGNGEPMNKKEQAAYDAAIQLLNMYFQGEVDCGSAPIYGTSGGDNEPEVPETVKV